jgi:tight adherence protein C
MSTSELSPLLVGLRTGLLVLAALAAAGLGAALGTPAPLSPPHHGPRARERARARTMGLFGWLEPLLLQLGGVFAALPLSGLRARIARLSQHAGEPLGLCPDELLALSLVSLVAAALCGGWVVHAVGMHWLYGGYLAALGPFLPVLRLCATVHARARQLERSLPAAIDLCVLCMGAGSDFPAALGFAVDELGPPHLVCRGELARVLDDLVLGSTRVAALRALAERTESRAVHTFVAAVCLAEEKGTPLVGTLSIQARVLRQERSVRAEEQAARAGVKMMAPMLLLVMSLMLLIFGPFLVNGAGL